MTQSSKRPRQDQRSIKFRQHPVKGAPFDLTEFVHEECAPIHSKNYKQSGKISKPEPTKMLTTTELISAIGHIWNYTSQSLALLQPQKHSDERITSCHGEDILGVAKYEKESTMSTSLKSKHLIGNLDATCPFPSIGQLNVDFFRAIYRISLGRWNDENDGQVLQRSLLGLQGKSTESSKQNGISTLRVFYGMQHIYGWMGEVISKEREGSVSCSVSESPTISSIFPGNTIMPVDCTSEQENVGNNLSKSPDACIHMINSEDLPSIGGKMMIADAMTNFSLYSDYYLGVIDGHDSIETDNNVSIASSSSLHSDYHLHSLGESHVREEFYGRATINDLSWNKKHGDGDPAVGGKSEMKIFPPQHHKPEITFAKQEHAFAGAFAGIFVSLCLHPVDTIKTVIQSCHAEHKPLFDIGKSIVSERGLTGLYRGLSSNIASSAPISAVYTFTYESIKGALLPLFPKEYYSVAHCLAGGCASIATSFIFTPSERIKQQMQVGSHYHNCWNALVGIIRTGGLPSLYAGWGAVLCRNIPHSVIKFYTYEKLKKWMLSSGESGSQSNTWQTLICGGVAGSTAALFTTPFDVVKTRLQTQRPGSVGKYDGVLHAIQEIGKHEGLKGLYRGLAPRLIMYISQGAIFFASYEFFKRVLSLDEKRVDVLRIHHNEKVKMVSHDA